MVSPISIQHINFIVSNLQASVAKYSQVLGLGPFVFGDLPDRGVKTARVKLGGSWLVLVCPTRRESVPGQFLEAHGEGFFLLSFGVGDLAAALKYYETAGIVASGSKVRRGLMDWRVCDLQTDDVLGPKFHLTEVRKLP